MLPGARKPSFLRATEATKTKAAPPLPVRLPDLRSAASDFAASRLRGELPSFLALYSPSGFRRLPSHVAFASGFRRSLWYCVGGLRP